MIPRLLLGAAPLLLAAAAVAAAPTEPEQLMQHIRVLASDEFEGRAPGSAGGERTEAYILEAFAKAGLKPGAAGERWRQTVTLLERRPESSSASFRAGGQAISLADDALLLVGREPRVTITGLPVLFAGFGRPEDMNGLDVANAVLLILAGDPPAQKEPLTLDARLAALAAAGAKAVIPIAPASAAWPQVRTAFSSPQTVPLHRVSPVQGALSADGASRLLRAAGLSLDSLSREAARPDFRTRALDISASFDVRTAVKVVETANIVGKIEGSGRPDQAVVLTAHWDHVGLCRPAGTPDRICNGAVDNASGTAILIEAARALAAAARPARSIYFVATTSEEIGLYGADAFATAPPPTIEKIVAVLNIDSTAIAPAGLPVAIIGRGRYPSLERVIDATARSLGRQVDPDTEANVMIQRQDGWAFAKRGIPAVMATGSVSDMRRLQGYLAGSYHKPNDDVSQRIELGGAVEDTDLHIALAGALADPVRYPGAPD